MKDRYGREIEYMRISVTDRCNLRCIYCMPEGVELVPREEILREQEILEIAGAAARLGISHVKLTGGEPLVRRCCRSLIREMKNRAKLNRGSTIRNRVSYVIIAAKLHKSRQISLVAPVRLCMGEGRSI